MVFSPLKHSLWTNGREHCTGAAELELKYGVYYLLTNCKQSFLGYAKVTNFILHFSISRIQLLPASGQEPERLPPHGVRL